MFTILFLLTLLAISFTIWVIASEFLPGEPVPFAVLTIGAIVFPWFSFLVALIYYFAIKPLIDEK